MVSQEIQTAVLVSMQSIIRLGREHYQYVNTLVQQYRLQGLDQTTNSTRRLNFNNSENVKGYMFNH